jgi:hypothetical protein
MKIVLAEFVLIIVIAVPISFFVLHDYDVLNFDVEQIEADSDGRLFIHYPIKSSVHHTITDSHFFAIINFFITVWISLRS